MDGLGGVWKLSVEFYHLCFGWLISALIFFLIDKKRELKRGEERRREAKRMAHP